jgi:hypothetical protein
MLNDASGQPQRWCIKPRPDGTLWHDRCDSHDSAHCFQIEGDISIGARITHNDHKGQCIGLGLFGAVSWPIGPSMVARNAINPSLRMMPCSGIRGYVRWRHAAPGGAGHVQVVHPGCTGARDQPRECTIAFAYATFVNYLQGGPKAERVDVMDTRLAIRVPEHRFLLRGQASYRLDQSFSPGEHCSR